MQIKTWTNFSKKKNSTKQPTGGTILDAALKDNVSGTAPIFTLKGDCSNINYIEAMGKKYFVSDFTHPANGYTDLICTEDYLGTWKTNIGNTSAYIMRSNSGSDMIVDPQIGPTAEVDATVVTEGDLLPGMNILNTNLVVRAYGKGTKNYIMTPGQVQAVMSTVFDTTFSFENVTDCLRSLFVSIANPSQYITSIKWFPFDVSGSSSAVPQFGFTVGNTSVPIAKNQLRAQTTITRPARHFNDFRDYDSRFSSYTVFLPGVGSIPVDAKYMENVLAVAYDIDVNTGACSVELTSGSHRIGSFSCNAGVDVPIGGLNGTGSLFNMLGMVTGVSINPIATISNAFGQFGAGVQNELSPAHTTTSAAGNMAMWAQNSYCQVSAVYMKSTGIPGTPKGKPDMNTKQIGALSGYVLCSEASVDMPGTSAEKEAVNAYLNSGFYYE